MGRTQGRIALRTVGRTHRLSDGALRYRKQVFCPAGRRTGAAAERIRGGKKIGMPIGMFRLETGLPNGCEATSTRYSELCTEPLRL